MPTSKSPEKGAYRTPGVPDPMEMCGLITSVSNKCCVEVTAGYLREILASIGSGQYDFRKDALSAIR